MFAVGCSGHETVEFRILRGGINQSNRIPALEFRRVNFDLFRDLLASIPLETILEGEGIQDSWQVSNMTSSNLKNDPSQRAENQATVTGGLCG